MGRWVDHGRGADLHTGRLVVVTSVAHVELDSVPEDAADNRARWKGKKTHQGSQAILCKGGNQPHTSSDDPPEISSQVLVRVSVIANGVDHQRSQEYRCPKYQKGTGSREMW